MQSRGRNEINDRLVVVEKSGEKEWERDWERERETDISYIVVVVVIDDDDDDIKMKYESKWIDEVSSSIKQIWKHEKIKILLSAWNTMLIDQYISVWFFSFIYFISCRIELNSRVHIDRVRIEPTTNSTLD